MYRNTAQTITTQSVFIPIYPQIKGPSGVQGALKSLMWSNCNACHSKFREEH